MENWNMVVTTAEGRYAPALEFLTRYGTVKPTAYYNVVMMQAENVSALMNFLSEEWERQAGRLLLLQRVVPMTRTFTFRDRPEFLRKATDILLGWTPRLVGKTFHVRMHRRGFKEHLSSMEAEQYLDAAMVEAARLAGPPAAVSFDHPDAVAAVETIGNHAGMSLWLRDDLQRYPFLHLD